jgi:hypothetical protein
VGTVTHLDYPSKHDVTVVDGNWLFCSCSPTSTSSNYKPCEHIFEAMKAGADAVSIGMHVTVPLYLEPIEGKFLCPEVEVRDIEARAGMRPFYFHDQRVGWLDQGEGRQQMRVLLLEFLRSQYRNVPKCQSDKHISYPMSAPERERCDLDSAKPEVIAAVAAILEAGICWKCMYQSNEDLVPSL